MLQAVSEQHTLEILMTGASSILLTIATFFLKQTYTEFKSLKKEHYDFAGKTETRLTRLETINEVKDNA